MSEDDSLFQQMRDRLVSAEFEPGQRLRAETLCKDYGCAASTMRETLFRLSTVGLVNFQEQRGFRQPEISPEIQHDLTLFRIMLESQGARLSIRLGGVGWESRLSAAHHKLSHIESRASETDIQNPHSETLLAFWAKAEQDFHNTLIDACGSPALKTTHANIYQQFRQQQINKDREFIFLPENIRQHQGILDAALNHDEDLVCQRIFDHLSRNLCKPVPEMATPLT